LGNSWNQSGELDKELAIRQLLLSLDEHLGHINFDNIIVNFAAVNIIVLCKIADCIVMYRNAN